MLNGENPDVSLCVGWLVNTRMNVAETARVTGVEFNYNQPLTFIPGWGRYLNFNASLTRLRVQSPRETDFNQFIPRSGNLVLTFSKKPVMLMVKWQYRGVSDWGSTLPGDPTPSSGGARGASSTSTRSIR